MRYANGCNPFKTHNNTLWNSLQLVYKVTHADGEFLLTSEGRINYKATIELLKQNGYKRPYITFIGRDVTM